MVKRAGDSEHLDRILTIMKLLQSHLEEANLDITEFEEVEIFLDLAIAAGERQKAPDDSAKADELLTG